ncbi:MAG: hypothetical protein LAO08_19465 [Acidobacteriia bacterium]|nr:hypothetical protein [Terriglobia bacterium]
MSSGTQVDLDWAGMDAGQSGAPEVPAKVPGAARVENGAGATSSQMTDEEILGMDSVGDLISPSRVVIPSEARSLSSIDGLENSDEQRDSSGKDRPRNDNVKGIDQETAASAAMPAWMQAVAADPKHAAEAQQLWQEHQAFRAAFSSAEEAQAMKELLPGGAQEVLALREAAQEVSSLRQIAQEVDSLRQSAASMQEAAQSVDRIDAAIFLGDARAQSEVVAEMARANPAAFRSMFAEAAKVLAGMDSGGREAGGSGQRNGTFDGVGRDNLTAGTQNQIQNQNQSSTQSGLRAGQSPTFDPAAYASFERSTNEVVARDVRGSIGETLARVLPEGVADGAARRIGEDIFNEVHRALAADRSLSEQVGEVLRERRFGSGEQERVAALLAGRAKQLVPSVARRVIGEWTSSVLGTARNKAARQAAAAARVDIAAPGGSLDSMPLRAMSPREVNYAAMSDDEILGM